MKRPRPFLLRLVHLGTLAGLAAAIAGAPGRTTVTAQAPAAPPNEPKWVQLFNGKDLTGWVPIGKEQWTVEDGTIYGVGVTKEYGYLRTENKYVDFDLTLRFKVEADGNSGVFFHSDFPPRTSLKKLTPLF